MASRQKKKDMGDDGECFQQPHALPRDFSWASVVPEPAFPGALVVGSRGCLPTWVFSVLRLPFLVVSTETRREAALISGVTHLLESLVFGVSIAGPSHPGLQRRLARWRRAAPGAAAGAEARGAGEEGGGGERVG